MKLKTLIALLLATLSFTAYGYELKGLTTGLTLAQLKNIIPVECEPETNFAKSDVINTVCYGDISSRPDFKTLATQPTTSYVFSLDKAGVVHQVTVGVSCEANPDIVVNALREKYGTPQKPFPFNHTWKTADQKLEFNFVTGTKNKQRCGFISIDDKAYQKAFGKKTDEMIKTHSPAKDL